MEYNTFNNNINYSPEEITKTYFSRNDKGLIRQLKREASVVCRGCIDNDYINKSFHQFSDGYVYKYNKNIIGFCIWKFINDSNNKRKLYLILICTEPNKYKLGTHILYDIERIAIASNIGSIKLQTTPQVAKFYKSIGFRINKNIDYKIQNTNDNDNDNDNDKINREISYFKNVKINKIKIRDKTLKRPKILYKQTEKRKKTMKKINYART